MRSKTSSTQPQLLDDTYIHLFLSRLIMHHYNNTLRSSMQSCELEKNPLKRVIDMRIFRRKLKGLLKDIPHAQSLAPDPVIAMVTLTQKEFFEVLSHPPVWTRFSSLVTEFLDECHELFLTV
jgi:hypothetical protein